MQQNVWQRNMKKSYFHIVIQFVTSPVALLELLEAQARVKDGGWAWGCQPHPMEKNFLKKRQPNYSVCAYNEFRSSRKIFLHVTSQQHLGNRYFNVHILQQHLRAPTTHKSTKIACCNPSNSYSLFLILRVHDTVLWMATNFLSEFRYVIPSQQLFWLDYVNSSVKSYSRISLKIKHPSIKHVCVTEPHNKFTVVLNTKTGHFVHLMTLTSRHIK